jgi:hypothetical protein
VRFWKLRQGGYADYLTAYSGLQIRQARPSSGRSLCWVYGASACVLDSGGAARLLAAGLQHPSILHAACCAAGWLPFH